MIMNKSLHDAQVEYWAYVRKAAKIYNSPDNKQPATRIAKAYNVVYEDLLAAAKKLRKGK